MTFPITKFSRKTCRRIWNWIQWK